MRPRGDGTATSVKLLSGLFLVILVALHGLLGAEAAALPLSMFRDGRFATLGYLAFLVLIAIGPFMVSASCRAGAYGDAAFYALASAALLVVALTPSMAPDHVFWSLALLLGFYVYYARLLADAASFWIVPHLLMPGALAIATQNFGLCQKSLIVYFLVVANVHDRMLAPIPRRRAIGGARLTRRAARLARA